MKRFRWHNVKWLQGHLTNTKQNSMSAMQQNEKKYLSDTDGGRAVGIRKAFGRTVPSSADAWKTPVKITMWEMRAFALLSTTETLCNCLSVFMWMNILTSQHFSVLGQSAVYLADECTLVTAASSRPLRSADNRRCLVKRSCNEFSDCCFATAGPTLWNSLPGQLRQPDITFGQFKWSLKTFMFR